MLTYLLTIRTNALDPRLVLETQLVLETRLLLKKRPKTPGLYWRPGFYLRPALYQKFWLITELQLVTAEHNGGKTSKFLSGGTQTLFLFFFTSYVQLRFVIDILYNK